MSLIWTWIGLWESAAMNVGISLLPQKKFCLREYFQVHQRFSIFTYSNGSHSFSYGELSQPQKRTTIDSQVFMIDHSDYAQDSGNMEFCFVNTQNATISINFQIAHTETMLRSQHHPKLIDELESKIKETEFRFAQVQRAVNHVDEKLQERLDHYVTVRLYWQISGVLFLVILVAGKWWEGRHIEQTLKEKKLI